MFHSSKYWHWQTFNWILTLTGLIGANIDTDRYHTNRYLNKVAITTDRYLIEMDINTDTINWSGLSRLKDIYYNIIRADFKLVWFD